MPFAEGDLIILTQMHIWFGLRFFSQPSKELMQNTVKDLPLVELGNPVDPTDPNELVKTHIS
jgi:hypothetical protein